MVKVIAKLQFSSIRLDLQLDMPDFSTTIIFNSQCGKRYATSLHTVAVLRLGCACIPLNEFQYLGFSRETFTYHCMYENGMYENISTMHQCVHQTESMEGVRHW